MQVCPASGSKMRKIPFNASNGFYIREDVVCPTCELILRCGSGTERLPRHLDRRDQPGGELTPTEIAEKVGDWHNNNFMKVHMKIYIDALYRAGFKIVKD